MAIFPGIPGERGYRHGQDAEANRLESQEARRLGIPEAKINIVSPAGMSPYLPAGMPWDHGIQLQETLAVGANTIAHGLGRTPTGMFVMADDARSVFVNAYRSAALSVPQSAWTDIASNFELDDWGGDYVYTNAATDTGIFTAPHTGIFSFTGTASLATVDADKAFGGAWTVNATRYYTNYSSVGSVANYVTVPLNRRFTLNSGATAFAEILHLSAAAKNAGTGYDETHITIRSDEALDQGTHDGTNIYLYSARVRTVSLWVW